MGKVYHQLAGRSLERLCGLSDGLFAIAMTLLVLDLRLPAGLTFAGLTSDAAREAALWHTVVHLFPELLTSLMSFLTLGIFWVGQQAQLNSFEHTDRDVTWIHLAFLCAVSLMPGSTLLLGSYIGLKVALFIYWFNIFLLGALLYASLSYAKRAKLFKAGITPELIVGQRRRIVWAQALYAIGAALCLIPGVNTYWSIGFIILVQLNYAIAPRIPLLNRL